MVKKRISLLMVLCMLFVTVSSSAAAEETLPADCFDFDFVLRVHPEAVSEKKQEAIAGCADFLNALRFEGSLTRAKSSSDFDLILRVIPVSQIDGAIEIRFQGSQDQILLNSSLLGDKTILLSTYSLLNFCSKMSEHLGIPLQYLALLYPYSWLYSLQIPINDWNFMLNQEVNGVIPDEWVSYLWNCWWWRVHDNEPLKILVDALCKDTEAEEAFKAVVNEIPDYFAKDFAQEKQITIRRNDSQTTMENYKGDVFFRKYYEGQTRGMELHLPRMKTGYLPVFSAETTTFPEWERQNSRITARLLGQGDQQDLVNLNFSMVSFPTTWPSDCWSLVSLDLTGTLLPNLGISCYVTGEKNGHTRIEVRKPTVEMEPGQIMLTVEGTLLPREGNVQIKAFSLDEEEKAEMLDLLVANDRTIRDFLPDLVEPMVQGLIKFLIGIPASACQTFMDQLTDLGVFALLFGE